MTKDKCQGCHNDYYNHRTNVTGKDECWSLGTAEVVNVFQISVHTPQDKASNFVKVRRPNCYQQQGMCYYPRLPKHLQ
jgi:hypothetical protein